MTTNFGYDEPKERLVNYPQSIMSGVTKEGGLVSLSFKSIKTAELVENLDLMRQSVVRPTQEFEYTKISEPFDAEKIKEKLEQTAQPLEHVSETNEISTLHKQLQNNDNKVGEVLTEKLERDNSRCLAIGETKIRSVQYNIDIDEAQE